MSNIIYLEINGDRYEGFTSINISKNLDSLTNFFSFSTTVKSSELQSNSNRISNNFLTIQNNVKVQDEVKVYIDSKLVITGYVETLDISYSATGHSIDISGRDRTADLVDSSIVKKQYEQRNFKRLIETVLSDNNISGIKVINNVSDISNFEPQEVIKVEQGDSIASFIDSYAKKLQVLVITNEDGNLVITRESNVNAGGSLISSFNNENNNVLGGNISINSNDRFYEIECVSQSSNNSTVKSTVRQVGKSIDTDIRSSRKKIIIYSKATDNAFLKNYAEWSRNIRKAKSSTYNCRVQGYYADKNNTQLWQPNKLVQIKDNFCQIDGEFLIQGITYSKGLDGSFTDLVIVNRGTFGINTEFNNSFNNFATNLFKKA